MATPSPEPQPPASRLPSLERGDLPPFLAEEAEEALESARASLETGRYQVAREEARRIIRQYPGAPGSGEALEILARASLALGDSEEAVDASTRFLGLLDPSHPAFPDAVFLQARSLMEADRALEALSSLVRMPAGAETAVLDPGADLLREAVGAVDGAGLEEALTVVEPQHPFRGILEAELAVALSLAGDTLQAREMARAARSRGLGPREAELVDAVLAGNVVEALGRPVVLGAVLPRSQVSPGLLDYGLGILEGIQVAVEEFQPQLRRPVQLEVRDNAGDPERGRASMRELEAMGALGVVGPLSQGLLEAVVGGRSLGTPVVSPFASLPSGEVPGVFSLSGPNPAAARVVAEYARDLGLETVAIMRPESPESQVSAEVFRGTFRDAGGVISREIVFDSEATFFQAEFQEVGTLLPDGLFLPLPADQVELLAPQFTFYGLDTLGIQVLGTEGWTEEEVVVEVDSRHTDGVIAATDRVSQGETEAFQRFREAYERLFQKTLRSEIPAYGYDAAALLLQALEENPETPAQLQEALNRIRDFPGATGRLSVLDGRIQREPHLVRIQDHELIYISPRYQ